LRIHYFREVPNEKPIPFAATVLHVNEHLLKAGGFQPPLL